MGPCSSELIINPLHIAERCCGAGPNSNWLNFNFCPPAARKTNQANAWSRGTSQGYPSVLLSWCQGLAPCLWIQQVNLLVLLCLWVLMECIWSSCRLADAQLRKQQFETLPLQAQAVVLLFFFKGPSQAGLQACVAEGKKFEGFSQCQIQKCKWKYLK